MSRARPSPAIKFLFVAGLVMGLRVSLMRYRDVRRGGRPVLMERPCQETLRDQN
ncbi:hypothetical protein M427DRAFT_53980 [Gonapodya prolifera JEL478]|uniref:Uncharacterized protein n=1 Tax=Gonapodya prolifera (strain JEL478) TaxID=1344416 RepID=A0A139AN09_GONPJ|nr:hypothetical protein M427DRAFT_53980 [Gonapodya prolifera JEL478]|eukprot:KXS18151.1 hypothetical protein M427DRAFT_53980 [Gonapodya prolifera JEL478]